MEVAPGCRPAPPRPLLGCDQVAPICAECFTGGFLYDIVKENAGLKNYHSGNKLSTEPIELKQAFSAN